MGSLDLVWVIGYSWWISTKEKTLITSKDQGCIGLLVKSKEEREFLQSSNILLWLMDKLN